MIRTISSAQNDAVKQLKLLMEKSRERKASGLFVIQGWKEILMAKEAGFAFTSLFIREDADIRQEEIGNVFPEMVALSRELFDKLTYRGPAAKALAIARMKSHQLKDLKLTRNPLIVVVDAVEKPGNIGAIIRSADATGVDAVICSGATDIYNPNVIRSSVGCIFSVPVATADKEEVLDWLKQHGIQVLTTSLKASIPYTQADLAKPTALVLGTEATGVDPFWEGVSDANIILPMKGKNDSLNVSNTAAVLLYEAIKQRSQGS